ncbi:uncharacterized protein LOC107041516 isoform X1 [Diachasma alloeum]|uniref:uncharacterized protein LOC107041516 isoform X1 n=1 Tax=Diachasma alloeum TaxID=454923 RepID=UPI0007384357|nr:uncharacterized protein LOC107041516 isoform X1 [Diachasma alloeum]
MSGMPPTANTDKMSPQKEDFLRNIAKDPVEMNDMVAFENDKNYRKELKEINEEVVSILPQKWKGKYTLSVFDNIISLAVVGPLVVGHWYGMWGLMDFYKLPLSDWLCILLGMGLHCTFACLRHVLHRTFAEHWRLANPIGRGGYRVARLVYTYLFGMSCLLHWRGGWAIFNYVVDDNLWVDAAVTLILFVLLIVLKSSRNLLAPPFIIAVDIPPLVFNFPTRYRANSRDCTLYILDCAFSVGVVGTLVVFVWRGIWVLLDLHLFPENREYSAIGSMVIGYILVAITFCFQPVMRYVCSRLQGLSRLLAADAFLVLSFLGTVNVWRGIWGLLEVWLFPDNVELSCWITHIGCFLFLGLLNCSNSILVRGVYIDAEEEEGKCVVFPCHYLRLFFKIEREKKEARRRNHVAPSRDYPPSESAGKDAENGALLNCTPLPTIIPPTPECLVLK